jgi:predicted dehydrogenase
MFRWGILSTAKIGREQLIPAILDSDNGVIQGIASRDERAAQGANDPVFMLENSKLNQRVIVAIYAAGETEAWTVV